MLGSWSVPSSGYGPELRLAGDGNRTRTISLGI